MPADVRRFPLFNFPFGIPLLNEDGSRYFDEVVSELFSDEEIQIIKDNVKKLKENTILPLLATSPEEVEDKFLDYFEMTLPYYIRVAAIYSDSEKITKFSEKSIKVEERFYEALKEQIPESLIDSLDALNDASLLMYSNIIEKGVKGFFDLILDRAQNEFMELGYHYMIVNFGFTTCLTALKEKRGSKETVDKLIDLVANYADELDSYLSTVDLLLSDEEYEVLKDYMQDNQRLPL